MGSLIVLLLAERTRSEGARATRGLGRVGEGAARPSFLLAERAR